MLPCGHLFGRYVSFLLFCGRSPSDCFCQIILYSDKGFQRQRFLKVSLAALSHISVGHVLMIILIFDISVSNHLVTIPEKLFSFLIISEKR